MRLGKFFIGFSFRLMLGVNRSWGKIKILSGRNPSPFRRKLQSFSRKTPILSEKDRLILWTYKRRLFKFVFGFTAVKISIYCSEFPNTLLCVLSLQVYAYRFLFFRLKFFSVIRVGRIKSRGRVITRDTVFRDECCHIGIRIFIEEAVVAYAKADNHIEVRFGLI